MFPNGWRGFYVLDANGDVVGLPTGSSTDPSGWTTIVSSADEDITNSSPQIDGTTDHTQFQFSVTAGRTYLLDITLAVSGNNATGDYAFRFYVSAGTMDGRGTNAGLSAADAATLLLLSVSGAQSSGSFVQGTTATLTIPTAARVTFAFTPSNTTTFIFSHGNGSASAGRTSRTMQGSVFRYKQMN